MSVNFKPIAGTQNRVLVKPAPAEEKTASGIIIPDTAKEKPRFGEVVAISDKDDKGNEPSIKVGDNVMYGQFSGSDLKIEGEEYIIMREADIFGIV